MWQISHVLPNLPGFVLLHGYSGLAAVREARMFIVTVPPMLVWVTPAMCNTKGIQNLERVSGSLEWTYREWPCRKSSKAVLLTATTNLLCHLYSLEVCNSRSVIINHEGNEKS